MHYVLKSGEPVEVYFTHEYKSKYIGPTLHDDDKEFVQNNVAKEDNWIHVPCATYCEISINGETFTTASKLHDGDVFQKEKGRLAAYKQLMGKKKPAFDMLSPDERRDLFFQVFPKYRSSTMDWLPEEPKSMNKLPTYGIKEAPWGFLASLKNKVKAIIG